MSKHTPGPWTVTRVSKSTIVKDIYISASPERIARVCVSSTAQSIAEYEANARLIAAAPDLLEALNRLLPMAEDGIFQYGGKTGDDDDIVFARAVIAKATGAAA